MKRFLQQCHVSLSVRGSKIVHYNLKKATGRFTIPKTPEDLRICDHCNQNSVENELHILFHCDQYNDLRKTLFIKINDRNTLFTNYNILVSFAAVIRVVTRHATLLPSGEERCVTSDDNWGGALRDE